MSHPSSDKSLEQILSEMDEDTKHDVTKAARAVPRLIAALIRCRERFDEDLADLYGYSKDLIKMEKMNFENDLLAILQGKKHG